MTLATVERPRAQDRPARVSDAAIAHAHAEMAAYPVTVATLRQAAGMPLPALDAPLAGRDAPHPDPATPPGHAPGPAPGTTLAPSPVFWARTAVASHRRLEELARIAAVIAQTRERLEPRAAAVIAGLYDRHQTPDEIGLALGVHPATVYRTKALVLGVVATALGWR